MLPRWSLAVLCAFVCAGLAYGASVLPWRTWTSFGVLTSLMAAMHAVTCVLAIVGSSWRGAVWRAQSIAAFLYLAWLAYCVTGSAAYLAALYGGLGRGVASVLVAFGVVAAALLVPAAVWGLAVTGLRWKRAAIGIGIVVVAFGTGVWRTAVAAPSIAVVEGDLEYAVADAMPDRWADNHLPIMTDAPAVCRDTPWRGPATIVLTFRDGDGVATECVQSSDFDAAFAQVKAILDERSSGRIAIDVVTGVRPLRTIDPVSDLFALRPGIDGVCEGTRCLMPWQLVALQQFGAVSPLEVLHEVRVGFDPAAIRAALGVPPRDGIDGLLRIETNGFATDTDGVLHAFDRLRLARRFDADTLRASVRAAEDYIASAQLPDGRFEYTLDPYTGAVSMDGFSVARQAGTTLVMCELAEDRERAAIVASASLQVLADMGSRHEDMLMLHDPVEPDYVARWFDLGDTALGAIAFISCRSLVGDRFDAEIDAMIRFLLAMQREDGSFHPEFDLDQGVIVRGPDPLFAVGQAIFALVLHEEHHPEVRAPVDAAMDYVAHDYWPGLPSDFFYMEENWHCLAARAALPHHRHDGYEQFCVDYVHWKSRLVLDEDDGVAPDLVGGYGFGNVVLPWSAGSATFGEAAAAGLAIIDARGLPREPVASRLRLALQFLLRHQWKDAECFACSAAHPIAGAWTEHPGSPTIRIDFVQHAMGALGHGARVLYTPA